MFIHTMEEMEGEVERKLVLDQIELVRKLQLRLRQEQYKLKVNFNETRTACDDKVVGHVKQSSRS